MARPAAAKLSAALVAALAASLHAQEGATDTLDLPDINRPAAADRVVRLFDFEGAGASPLPVPEGWFRGQDDPVTGRTRDGFPVWNRAELVVSEDAAHGRGAMRLPTSGGSTSLLLRPGVVAVLPGADYAVTARIRTEGLEHASAVVAARLLDEDAQPIPGAEWFTDPIRGINTWAGVRATVHADVPGAAFLQVELMLLQPETLADVMGTPANPGTEALTVWPQDVSGAAWFDDVAILQRPGLDVTPESPTGVFSAPDRPAINLVMRDLTGERLTVRVRLVDHTGREIDRIESPPQVGVARLRWVPRIENLGWYRVDATVESGGRVVARSSVPIAYLPPPPRPAEDLPGPLVRPDADRARFELLLAGTTPAALDNLADLVALSGSGAVTIPVWNRLQPDDHDARALLIEPAIDQLLDGWTDLTLTVPSILPAGTPRGERVTAAFVRDPIVAAAVIEPYLDRFGQRVQSWMLGEVTGLDRAPPPAPQHEVDAVRELLEGLVPSPIIRLRESYQAVSHRAPHAAVVGIPPSLGDAEVAAFAEAWAGITDANADTTFAFELPSTVPAGDGLAQLARQTVRLWHDLTELAPAGEWRLGITEPWTGDPGPTGAVRPRPALAGWRMLSDRLVGRVGVDLDPLAPDTVGILLVPSEQARPERDAMLVAWATGGDREHPTLELPLGDTPIRVTDALGNTIDFDTPDVSQGGAPVAHVPVGREPVFIEGVDPQLLQMVASLRITPGLVQSRPGEHNHLLHMTNPWSVPLRGRTYILEPGGLSDPTAPRDRSWNIDPRVLTFTIQPGETAQLPVNLAFAAGEEAGDRELVVDIEAAGGLTAGLVRRAVPFRLGLDEAALEAAVILKTDDPEPGPDTVFDAIVTAEVTNRSNVTLAADVILISPGHPRQKATISEIAPGETVLRRFVFPVSQTDRGLPVRVGLTLIDDGARLTRTLDIP